MYQILISCQEAVIAAIPLVPIYLVLYRRKIRHKNRTIVYLLFSIYLSTMYAAVGLPDITYFRYSPRFNLIPFRYMFTASESTLLNVFLFLPLGFLMPVLWKEYKSSSKTILLGFCISLSIELLQILTYRATDINDLITNTFGTYLGYLTAIVTLRAMPAISPESDHQDIFLVFATSFGVMFFIYPFISLRIQ